MREICKLCWEVSRVGFTVPDEIWNAVAPVNILCLGCFTKLADEAGLEWDRDIQFWPVSQRTAHNTGQSGGI